MAEASETFGFASEEVERIVDAVRKVEQMAPRVRLQRRHSPITGTELRLGVLDGACTGGGTATMSVWFDGADTGQNITVNNWFTDTVAAGKVIVASIGDGWYIISADCA